MRIAVDAMGGDHAPHVQVEAALMAASERPDLTIALVGPAALVGQELTRHGAAATQFQLIDAPEIIAMDESPAQAVRRKPRSSIVLGARLQREGRSDALVSAGNTGAAVAASLIEMGRLRGVTRPAIAIYLPNLHGGCIVLDVGANADCKPANFLQFAIMGELYARLVLKHERPKIGLLNIGEEESKGSELYQEGHRLLAESSLNFVGNVEGRDMFAGVADVVVCDGFVGNVLLKFAESMGSYIGSLLREELRRSLRAKAGALLLKSAFTGLWRRIDYAEYGGAPLLGVDGVTIIAHGSSSPKAMKNAIIAAARLVESGTNREILARLEVPAGNARSARG
jgi:glycerol-3-phosphate acyltransferase PlsX